MLYFSLNAKSERLLVRLTWSSVSLLRRGLDTGLDDPTPTRPTAPVLEN